MPEETNIPDIIYLIAANDGCYYEFSDYHLSIDYIRTEKLSGMLLICEVTFFGSFRKSKIKQRISFEQPKPIIPANHDN